jgi:acyl transferase domain-containing protein
MNAIGKIFVFSVFVMSLVLMTFAGAVYVSHTNWKDEIERTPEQCIVGQRPGYKYLLQEADSERQSLQDQITSLIERVSATERARDQVVAKLQTAIAEKSGELDKLRKEQETLRSAEQQLTERLKVAQDELAQATGRVETLRDQVAEQQGKVDAQVGTAAKLAAELEEAKSFLAMANERKEQLEKQVQNARDLLKQSGLTLDSLPRDRVPALDGDVLAVAQDSIQVSLGSDDGLQIGHTLEVYRSGQYVGRAIVRSVKPDSAVAVLVKEFVRGIVQRGDKVTTRLKA